jgi:hypothetical protein
LLQRGGYVKGDPIAYDKKLPIFPDEVVEFVRGNEPDFWERFSALNNGNAKAVLIESLVRELRTKRYALPFCVADSNVSAKLCAWPSLPKIPAWTPLLGNGSAKTG